MSNEEKKAKIQKAIDESLSTLLLIISKAGIEPLKDIDANNLFTIFLQRGLHAVGIEVDRAVIGGEGIVPTYGKEALKKEIDYNLTIGDLLRRRTRFQVEVSLKNEEGMAEATGNYYIDDAMKLHTEEFRFVRHQLRLPNKVKEELNQIIPSREDFFDWLIFYVLTRLMEELIKRGLGGS